ncbi:MAG TPA: type 2 isopentenyl-diphosphate Delta-isomerase [Candidatus Lokiarchaeia archaeon]|nr:type 2 isopentenyl-diphosphate Delta-isomerase [Candidatus Lokiarchaeia archaeon]
MDEEQRVNEDRKLEHLTLICEKGMQASRNWMEDVYLHPRAIPTVDPGDIDMSCSLFGRHFNAPFYVAGMTGGHSKSKVINEILARACAEAGIPLGLGSQRVALDNEDLVETFKIARDVSDELFLIGNIGMSQLVKSPNPIIVAKKSVDMIKADALAIHFNKLQELVQPEGDRMFSKIMDIVESIAYALDVPVILKEVGTGFSRSDFEMIKNYRIGAIDVGGFGGTNFALVEAERLDEDKNPYTRNMGDVFKDCGIPTPASIILAKNHAAIPTLATGGIRTGLDVVKAICLGANMAGLAYPFLIACLNDITSDSVSTENTMKEIESIETEIRIAMCLLNAQNVGDLEASHVHCSAELRAWIS